MRVLVANDGFDDAGGVQSYLDSVLAGLHARGHELALMHRDAGASAFRVRGAGECPAFSAAEHGVAGAVARARDWKPDVAFSHNMNLLELDRALTAIVPVVKFMHGYFGTCIGGLKHHAFPSERPCDRVFGAGCLALYLPRYCGQLSPTKLVEQYRWAAGQRQLFGAYRAIVVASEHMRREYVRNGAAPARVHANPLFPTHRVPSGTEQPPAEPTVVFMGRMTPLKGGDLLIRATADASRRLPRAIRLVMIGDGPARPGWERLAARLGVAATFTGWQEGDARWPVVRRASLVAVPSVWPEPFGLVGLEASALGVPAIAFDVGGVGEWLHPGKNGVLVSADPPTAQALADALADILTRPVELAAMRRMAPEVARGLSLDRHLDRLEAILAA